MFNFWSKEKPLSKMTRQELRREELLLDKERAQLLTRIGKIAADKQTLFARGAGEKTPEVRRTLAQEFELKTTEQLMIGRQLNIRSKEMLTVSRLRMLRENAGGGLAGALGRVGIREGDLATIARLIENDSITTEMYQQRLDEILEGARLAEEGGAGLSPAGQELLKIWNDMDAGLIKDTGAAFEEAERRVRERGAAEA